MGNKYYCKLVLKNIKTWKISTRLFDTEEDLIKFIRAEHTKRNYIIMFSVYRALNTQKSYKGGNEMIKTIYEYDGQEFTDYDELEEYVANLTGGEYNNADPFDTPAFYEAMEEVERREVEWHDRGYHEEISNAIKPILNSIEIEVHTTLDKNNLNKLIKFLQIAVNRIDKKGFYGNQ